MDDVKGKVKGFMKKVNNPFTSSSSGKFKGQGRVLGSSSTTTSSSASPSAQPLLSRVSPTGPANPKPPSRPPNQTPGTANESNNSKPSGGEFSPFETLISSGKRTANGCSVKAYDCPVCFLSFPSEEDVSSHVESCLEAGNGQGGPESSGCESNSAVEEARDDLALAVGAFLSGGPPEGSVEVVMKLLGNVVRDPENAKFRRVRMSNPKIKEAVGDAKGGVELLECVGFRLGEEEGEVWATMGVPVEKELALIKEAVLLLEKWKEGDSKVLAVAPSGDAQIMVEPKKIDRKVRVYFLVPDSVPEKIELPDSFYNLSAEEIRREVELRKKKLSESQLLIPKSYKEKQMKAAWKKYKATVIRIQFPDGVLLQAVFLPWEPTTALYQFVSSSLKDSSLEFELLQPAPRRLRPISRFPRSGGKPPTLEEEDLVPSALVKFKPIETDSIVFTGLSSELLEAGEPLTAATSAIYT